MRVLFSLLVILFFASNLFSQEKRNIIWFTAKSPSEATGFNEGQTVPNLSIKDVNKKRFKLHDQLNKLTVIDFRNMKCQTCAKNTNYLKRFYKQYAINIISIYDDARSVEVKSYAAKNGMNWTNVQDDAPPRDLLKKQLNLNESPDYIVLSPDKKVLKVFKDGNTVGKLGAFLQQHFAGK